MSARTRRLAAGAGMLVATAVAAVALAAPAAAESIQDFQVTTTVNADTSFQVVETIRYDFEGAYRHGIFRDIPVYDETLSGQRRTYDITVDSVTMDGAPVPWVTSDNAPFLNLRIGDPNTTITGPHDYVVTYTVRDGLRVLKQDDVDDPQAPAGLSVGDVELYWDFVGTGWQVPISRAQASVIGPAPTLAAKCFYGPGGSTSTCTAAAAKNVVSLGPVSLGPSDALTGSIVWPSSAFSRVPTENVRQGLPTNPLLGVAGGFIPALALILIPAGLALRRRREDAGTPIPGAPPQYAPPDDLAPAEMYAAWKGRKGTTNARVLLATLIDLASRRWLNARTEGRHLVIDWVGTGTTPLRPWEESVVGLILKGQPSGTLEGYDKALATTWASDFRGLVAAQEASGRRNPKGDVPDQRWRWIAAVAVVVLLIGGFFWFVEQPFVSALAFTIGIGALIGFTVARIITPRAETPQSAVFLAKVAGFEKVLGTDPAAARREFAQRSGLSPAAIFATMLPYAIVFDLEDSWLGAFPDLTPDELATHGFYVAGGMWAMNDLVSTGTTSMSSAMTAPSSGSGGGGSSGGGGGGGGGGSW